MSLYKIKTFISNYWFFILLSFIVAVLAFITFVAKKSPEAPSVSPSPASKTTSPSWQGIKPGETQETELKEKLGQPIKESQEKEQNIIEYPSGYEFYHHKVYTKNQTVALIKEQITYEQNLNLETYITQYGKPPLIMYEKDLGATYPLNIFPEQGVAAAAHLSSDRVVEVWYFRPMRENEFLQSIGKELTLSPPKQF